MGTTIQGFGVGGFLFRGPYNEDYRIFGFILGFPN